VVPFVVEQGGLHTTALESLEVFLMCLLGDLQPSYRMARNASTSERALPLHETGFGVGSVPVESKRVRCGKDLSTNGKASEVTCCGSL